MSCQNGPGEGPAIIPITSSNLCGVGTPHGKQGCQDNLENLRAALLTEIDAREGGNVMIVSDYKTRDLLVDELAYRTRVPVAKIDRLPVKILRAVFEQSAGPSETSYNAHIKKSEIALPFTSAAASIGTGVADMKISAVIFGFAAFIAGISLRGACKEVQDARQKNADLGKKLLHIAESVERNRKPACGSPGGSCTMC